ncbi:flagellar hook-length control protein FliK [Halomonas sp. TBZ9]|uniref:Flagellar hook-length control protein FliK n=1 Tax=Vreelandella azerica TaxID=2732867 RepID=A0A7Y3TY06_9GAMM|nr:flagellar hook-length control protein FliK [Halomonas azerica]NOG32321.1 flagellar hook-length control protein FliK [Halomonas azerica]
MNVNAMFASIKDNIGTTQQSSARSQPDQDSFVKTLTKASGKSSPTSSDTHNLATQLTHEPSRSDVKDYLQALGIDKEQLQRNDIQELIDDIIDQPALFNALDMLANSILAGTSDETVMLDQIGSTDSEPNVISQLELFQEMTQRLALENQLGHESSVSSLAQASFLPTDFQLRQTAGHTISSTKPDLLGDALIGDKNGSQSAEKLMGLLQSILAGKHGSQVSLDYRGPDNALLSASLSSSGGLNGDSTTLLDATQRPHSLADSGAPPTRGSSDLLLAALNAANMSSRTNAGQDGFELPTQGMNAQGLSMSAQANVTSSLAQTAQGSLQAPLTSAAWPRELGQQLVQFAQRGGEQQIKLNIHPAELGPLSVSLKMSEQGTQAHFLSAHAQVRQVIEQAIPQLREALAEQGIMLADTSVGEQRQQDGDEAALAGGGNGQGDSASGPNESEEPGNILPQRQSLTLDGRVDLYA